MEQIVMVTMDRYQTPLLIADSVPEMAKKCGVSKRTIYKSLRNLENGNLGKKKCRFYRVEIDEDEDE